MTHRSAVDRHNPLTELANMLLAVEEEQKSMPEETMQLVLRLRKELKKCCTTTILPPAEPLTIVQPAEPLTIENWITTFCNQYKEPRTHENHVLDLRRMARWCTTQNLAMNQIQSKDIVLYLQNMGKACSANTTAQRAIQLRKFFEWLHEHHLIQLNPFSGLCMPQRQRSAPQPTEILTVEEIRSLFQALDTGNIQTLRNRAMVGLMFYACASTSMILNMRTTDCLESEDKKALRIKAGTVDCVVPLDPQAAMFLAEYMNAASLSRKDDRVLFPSVGTKMGKPSDGKPLTDRKLTRRYVRTIVRACGRKANLDRKLTPAQLSASGFVALLQSGAAPEDVRQWPRTLRMGTVARYQRLARTHASDLSEFWTHAQDIRQPLRDFIARSGIFRLPSEEKEGD